MTGLCLETPVPEIPNDEPRYSISEAADGLDVERPGHALARIAQ
jgi:hypothetical protein